MSFRLVLQYHYFSSILGFGETTIMPGILWNRRVDVWSCLRHIELYTHEILWNVYIWLVGICFRNIKYNIAIYLNKKENWKDGKCFSCPCKTPGFEFHLAHLGIFFSTHEARCVGHYYSTRLRTPSTLEHICLPTTCWAIAALGLEDHVLDSPVHCLWLSLAHWA